MPGHRNFIYLFIAFTFFGLFPSVPTFSRMNARQRNILIPPSAIVSETSEKTRERFNARWPKI